MIDHQSCKVVVVDDEEHALTGWLEVLRNAGYRATGAATFEEGRRLLDSYEPDLLITDVRLGEYNGLQLVLRARRQARRIPSIVVTAFSDSLIRAEAEQLDAVYLEKPVDASQMLAVVAEVLGTTQ